MVESLEGRWLLSFSSGASATAAASGRGPQHLAIPTTTVLQASTTTAETSQAITFTVSVENANRNVPITSGRVKFIVESPRRSLLKQVSLNKQGEAGITTSKLSKIGTYTIDALYVPSGTRFAGSLSNRVLVMVTPLTAASFLVTPKVRHGHLGKPLTFTVTALDRQKHPLTNYAGTVALSSPTDSWTTFPPGVYVSLGISAPPRQSIGLATFPDLFYTFVPSDHGTHTFVGGVTFNKGGAEILKVTQANNAKVFGKTTFAIA
jgi:hypothetical protein